MDDTGRFLLILGGSGLAGILLCSLFGAAAERSARRQLNLRKDAELPEQVAHRAWESTARPIAILLGTFGAGLVVLHQTADATAVFAGLVFGATLRGLIANTRSS